MKEKKKMSDDKFSPNGMHGKDKHFSPKFFETEGSMGKFQKGMHWVTSALEGILAIVLVAGILFSFVRMPETLFSIFENGTQSLMELVEYIAIIIIAIELIHVIMCQNLDSVIEILMMAFTRELVIRDWAMWELLLGVLVVAGLFAVKKYLLSKEHK